MTPLHKSVAKALLASVEAEGSSDASVVAALAAKTASLVAQLNEVYPDGVPADAAGTAAVAERLTAQGVPESTQLFLRAAALAELGAEQAGGAQQ